MPQRRNGAQQRNDGKKSGGQKSEDITFQLEDWHPAPGGHMHRADDYDIVRLDAFSTNAPLWIRMPGIWLASLRTRISVRALLLEWPKWPDLDKGIHGPPNMVRKPEHVDRISLTCFVANLNLALVLQVAWPLKDVRLQLTRI